MNVEEPIPTDIEINESAKQILGAAVQMGADVLTLYPKVIGYFGMAQKGRHSEIRPFKALRGPHSQRVIDAIAKLVDTRPLPPQSVRQGKVKLWLHGSQWAIEIVSLPSNVSFDGVPERRILCMFFSECPPETP